MCISKIITILHRAASEAYTIIIYIKFVMGEGWWVGDQRGSSREKGLAGRW